MGLAGEERGKSRRQENSRLGAEHGRGLDLELERACGVVRGAEEELLGSLEFILRSVGRGPQEGLSPVTCHFSPCDAFWPQGLSPVALSPFVPVFY